MKIRRFITIILLMFVFIHTAGAVESEIRANIEKNIKEIFPDMEISSIRMTEIEGLYEIMQGAELYYVSGDGRYFIQGNMYDLQEKRNLSEVQRSIAREELLDNLSSKDYIEFAPENTQHTVYVFTDTDCSYCRRLHSHIDDINKLGIAVRYLAFPRSGEDTETFYDMESVWCSSNRNQALTSAKLGKKPVRHICANPVAKQFELGLKIGVRGTPSIFLEDNGDSLGGYMEPEELAEAINNSLSRE